MKSGEQGRKSESDPEQTGARVSLSCHNKAHTWGREEGLRTTERLVSELWRTAA